MNRFLPSRPCAIGSAMLLAIILLGAETRTVAEGITPDSPALPEPVIPPPPSPLTQLVWLPEHLEMSSKLNATKAEVSFMVTNISDFEVVVDHVTTSCGCTVAKLPSQPWHLAAHAGGELGVTIDLMGKFGTLEKSLNVFFADTNQPPKTLHLTVHMPGRNAMRASNLLAAQADRQAVFKGDCAQCHVEPAKNTSDIVLFHKICGICHEAAPLATMVPNLTILNHPADHVFWQEIITNGKTNSLMPAFAISQGGPLTDAQIEDLVQVCLRAFPNRNTNVQTEPSSKK